MCPLCVLHVVYFYAAASSNPAGELNMNRLFFPLLILFIGTAGIAQITAPQDLLRENFSNTRQRLSGIPLPVPGAMLRSGLTDALDQAFDSVTALSTLKGFNAAVLLPDSSVWKRAHGTNSGTPIITPLTTGHLMGMGSITKTFVSATLLLMVEDGLLSLDDSIGQYVGPYPNISGQATVRQLLSHRTGFNDYLNENPATASTWLVNQDSIWEADTILSHFVLQPNFPVGAGWSYSNTNFLLAGRIIENITGQPWYQVVRERLLIPQGLTHTFAYPWESTGGQPVAHVWLDLLGNGTVEDVQGWGYSIDGFFSLGGSAGCLMTTPEDIAKFNERLFGGHILQPATLAEMQTDYVQDATTGIQYGLGAISYLGLPFDNWGHDGSIFYKSFGLYFPDLGVSIVVQQNDDRTAAMYPQLIDLVDVFLSLLLTYVENAPSSGVATPESATHALVVPNPASDVLHVQLPMDTSFPVTCVLTDACGRVVMTTTFDQPDGEMRIAQLPEGVYGLCVGGFLQKVVVRR